MPVPLPQWFARGLHLVMIKVSYLENFAGYMWNNDTEKHRELQNELSQTKFNKS